jgi:hypothetical protein
MRKKIEGVWTEESVLCGRIIRESESWRGCDCLRKLLRHVDASRRVAEVTASSTSSVVHPMACCLEGRLNREERAESSESKKERAPMALERGRPLDVNREPATNSKFNHFFFSLVTDLRIVVHSGV